MFAVVGRRVRAARAGPDRTGGRPGYSRERARSSLPQSTRVVNSEPEAGTLRTDSELRALHDGGDELHA